MKKISLLFLIIAIVVLGDSKILFASSKDSFVWVEDENGWSIQYSNGSYAYGEYVDGYWIDADGYLDIEWDGSWMCNGSGWWFQSQEWYPANAWLKVDQDWYYFDGIGYMATNRWVGNYYVSADGKMLTDCWIGKWYVDSTGKWSATKQDEVKQPEPEKKPVENNVPKSDVTKAPPDNDKAKTQEQKVEDSKEEPKEEEPKEEEPKEEEPKEDIPIEDEVLSEEKTNVLVIGDNELELDIKYLGEVKGIQSFCIYNDKYYSTDGNYIYVQDLDFNEIEKKEMMLGHGNSFQLGSKGYSYISGWDDNKIYVVDLNNLEVVNVINLPTSGYTTGVIDDTNKLAYILQRDSFPNSLENYNLIVYDYANELVVNESILEERFGALQSCDIKNGMILVTSGLGKEELPTGYRVYDTSGKLCGEYKLEGFNDIETEGAFFDRESNNIFISTVKKKVYIVNENNDSTNER